MSPGGVTRVLALEGILEGAARSVFSALDVEYVEVVPEGDKLPFDDRGFDLVISGLASWHSARSSELFREMARVVADNGFVVVVAPSAGGNITAAACAELAEGADCQLLNVTADAKGPHHHGVGIFAKAPVTLPERPTRRPAVVPAAPRSSDPAAEAARGDLTYLEALARIHQTLEPATYLEIGVHRGSSLRLAECPAVAVDPDPRVTARSAKVMLYTQTSDDFFRFDAGPALQKGVDLAFVDGMHLFEYALRDFMNIEKHAHAATVVVFDDVLPNHPVQALRQRESFAWCGDVWKIAYCLTQYRPDLSLTLLDTYPTGLLLVTGLDPDSRVLWESYDTIVEAYLGGTHSAPPEAVLSRAHALSPGDARVATALEALRDARTESLSVPEVRSKLAASLTK
ncbi:MAG: type 11 methyltransferase [Frankiales bacterium]|nr:type 11 methyltransferase [Frankiales bacterium]